MLRERDTDGLFSLSLSLAEEEKAVIFEIPICFDIKFYARRSTRNEILGDLLLFWKLIFHVSNLSIVYIVKEIVISVYKSTNFQVFSLREDSNIF